MAASIKFTNPKRTDFHKTVTERVDRYFEENHISKFADGRMVFKTVVMFALYFVPYFLILSGWLPAYGMLLACIVMGLGLAGIGMSVMHDANHGAYSEKRWVNQLLGYSLDLVGGNSFNWKIQHNIRHHTFTNIHGHDLDIRERMNLRLTPAVKRNWLHRFQIFYAFILYALQTFFWALIKDFFQLVQFANENADKQTTPERVRRFAGLVAEKVLYVTYLIVIPKLVLHISWAEVFIGFLAMHLVAGFVLTLVFQLAHVVESTQFPEPDNKGNIAEEWAIHQMQTTADFAPANKLVTFYVGGLNYQVEHHLFQRICHIHYPAIAPIVKQTAQEYGVPYLCNPTFADAVRSHFRFINQLGIRDTMRVASDF